MKFCFDPSFYIFEVGCHFWAKNNAILTIFKYFDQLLGILTTFTLFLPVKNLIGGHSAWLIKYSEKIFDLSIYIFEVGCHSWAKNDVILTIFNYFDQLLGIFGPKWRPTSKIKEVAGFFKISYHQANYYQLRYLLVKT